jgi:aspartyl/asparaginyl-tRNA synthetase
MPNPIDPALVVLVDAVAFEIRRFLKTRGFVEILPPMLVAQDRDIGEAFSVKHGRSRGALKRGSLSFLLQALPHIDKVFAFSPSLRPKPVPDHFHLIQFHYIEILFRGEMKDCLALIRGMLSRVHQAASKHVQLGESPQMSVVDYREACESLRLSTNSPFGHEEQMRLIEQFGGNPVAVTSLPLHVCPVGFIYRHGDTGPSNYDVYFPTSGEVFSGGVIEHDIRSLRSRLGRAFVGSPYTASSRRSFDTFFSRLSHARGAASVNISLERLIQHICQCPHIHDAAVFPIPAKHDRSRSAFGHSDGHST